MKTGAYVPPKAAALPAKRNLLSRTGNIFIRTGRFLTRRATIVEIISALLIILFIYTGLNKMMDYEKFRFEMGRSPFIQNMSGFIAATLPAGEILLALALIIKRTRLLGLYLSFFLMALFTGYIWLMLNYAYDLPCSCGGVLSAMTWHDHLIFNGVFTGLAMIGVILQSKINSGNTTLKKAHTT
jgi:hypothetical protein